MPVPPDQAPWFISAAYIALCWAMDVIYDKRPIQVSFRANIDKVQKESRKDGCDAVGMLIGPHQLLTGGFPQARVGCCLMQRWWLLDSHFWMLAHVPRHEAAPLHVVVTPCRP